MGQQRPCHALGRVRLAATRRNVRARLASRRLPAVRSAARAWDKVAQSFSIPGQTASSPRGGGSGAPTESRAGARSYSRKTRFGSQRMSPGKSTVSSKTKSMAPRYGTRDTKQRSGATSAMELATGPQRENTFGYPSYVAAHGMTTDHRGPLDALVHALVEEWGENNADKQAAVDVGLSVDYHS